MSLESGCKSTAFSRTHQIFLRLFSKNPRFFSFLDINQGKRGAKEGLIARKAQMKRERMMAHNGCDIIAFYLSFYNVSTNSSHSLGDPLRPNTFWKRRARVLDTDCREWAVRRAMSAGAMPAFKSNVIRISCGDNRWNSRRRW